MSQLGNGLDRRSSSRHLVRDVPAVLAAAAIAVTAAAWVLVVHPFSLVSPRHDLTYAAAMDELWRSESAASVPPTRAALAKRKQCEKYAEAKRADAGCVDTTLYIPVAAADVMVYDEVAQLEQPAGVVMDSGAGVEVAITSLAEPKRVAEVVSASVANDITAESECESESECANVTTSDVAAASTKKKRHFAETAEPVVWHLSHRPARDKPRRKLTQLDDIAQIGFGGCGGMYNYFLGVASVLQEEYDLSNVIFSGVSAGCFPAMVLALGMDVKEFFFKENLPLIEHAATCSYAGLGKWIPLVRANTLKMLPRDAYKQVDGTLYFSVTEVPALRNHVLTTWTSNEDMVDCMLCSGHVPLYTDSLVANYRGKRFVDGGLSNNHPIVHPDRPHKMLQIWKWRWISPTWVLVTTSADWALELFRMGREDALKRLPTEIDDAFFTAPAPAAAKRSRLL